MLSAKESRVLQTTVFVSSAPGEKEPTLTEIKNKVPLAPSRTSVHALQTKSSVRQGEQKLGLRLNHVSDEKAPFSQDTRRRKERCWSRPASVLQGPLALLDTEFPYLLIKVKFTNTAHKSQETSQKVEYKNLKETQSENRGQQQERQACEDEKVLAVVSKLCYEPVQSSSTILFKSRVY